MCKVLEGMSAALQWGVWFVGSQNNKERPGQECLEGVPCTGPRWGSYSHLDVFVDFPSVFYRQSPSRRKISLGFYPNCYILRPSVGRNSS